MVKKKKKSLTKKPSISDRIVDVLDIDTEFIMTLFGRPGSGKTTTASTMPKPQLIIDAKDHGTESAKGSTKGKRGEIEVLSILQFDDIFEIYDYIVENPDKYKSVIIDHMTALQEIGLGKVKEDEGKDQVSQRMYGIVAGYLKEVISLYKELAAMGIKVCFLAQDRMEGGEGEGEDQLTPEVGPGLMPSVSRILCAASRVVGHTYMQEKVTKTKDMKVRRDIEYRLRLGPNPYYITKVTKSKDLPCPAYIVDPSYDKVMDIINGDYEEELESKPGKKKSKTGK